MQFRLLSLVTCCLLGLSLWGQNVMPLGQWRAHLPYQNGLSVTQSENEVFFATRQSILILDKEERSTDFLSKVEGLSNADIRLVKYIEGSEVLMVVYQNSVIDLYQDGKVLTLNNIKNFVNFPGAKVINDVFVQNDSIVYLSASYGISKFNVKTARFVFSTFTGVEVNATAIYEGNMYIATDEGVYRLTEAANFPEDFTLWELLGPDEGFPGDYSSQQLTRYENRLYLGVDHDLYYIEGEASPTLVHEAADGYDMEYLSAEGAHLLAGYRCRSNCSRSQVFYFDKNMRLGELAPGCIAVPYYALEDQKGRVWFADDFRAYRMVENITDPNCNLININSPWSEKNWQIIVADDELWIAAGALNQTLSQLFLDHGFFRLKDGQWTTYNRYNTSGLDGEDKSSPEDDLFDLLTVAVHPTNGTVYGGSFFSGLAEMKITDNGNEVKMYNFSNSPLEKARGDEKRTRISGLDFDEQGNLWISNHSAFDGHPIAMLNSDGNFQTFSKSCGETALFEVDVDLSGIKWFIVGNAGSGVVAFNEGELGDPNDDRCKEFNASNSELTTNATNCLVADLEGDVWVGTDDGVIIFECGGSAFDPACTGTRRVVEWDDGFNGYLMESQSIQALAVDGANRKWVGTTSGVFLLAPDGEELVARFTAENSPLPDNTIIDIAVNDKTGEVFFGTNKGVVSYQGDAIGGFRINQENIEVFPNPVRPDYIGDVTIRGLARDATVKITDVNGKLVYETKALGGQAIWNGNDYNGRRANSGVYLVFSSSNPRHVNFGKPDGAVAKIVLIH